MMAPASPRKSHEPTVTDLENGRPPSLTAPSPLIQEANGSLTETLEARRSLQYEEGVSHSRSPSRWWEKVADRIPPPFATRARKSVDWIKGPQPPQIYHIKPFFEPVQLLPLRIISRLPRLARVALLILAFVLWVVLFGVILSQFSLPSNIDGFGAPVRLSCIAQLWPDPQSCGLDGRNCLPFDGSSFAFQCPADCAGVEVLNPKTIGDQQIVYRSLVVGGTSNLSEQDALVYRGDSFICGAAIHAGVLKGNSGGCGVLSLVGEKANYGSINRNGISSVGFDSNFPLSFIFNQSESVSSSAHRCRDPRWNLLTLSTIMSTLFSLFTTTPASFFVPVFIIVYFQVALATDPPAYSDYPSLASTAVGSFLPAAFIGALIYRFIVRKTLRKLRAQFEKTVLWLGACWVGAMSNYTLEMIPIQRLTSHDLHQQPGALTALVIIVLVLFGIVLYQAWCYRNEGRLLRYLALYATLGIGLLILLAIPSLELRIHHYVLALLLLPGTSLQTRPSLLYQGLLIGLFINGIARWGFASVLQTSAELLGDALLGSGIPSVHKPVITSANISFTWDALSTGWDGMSVLVNDVERFRGVHSDGDSSFTWTRQQEEWKEYFRFGFVNYLPFGGLSYSDFTMAGVWWPNGTWTDIPPGST